MLDGLRSGNGIAIVAAVVLPMFARRRALRPAVAAVCWVLHVLLLALTLLGLWQLHRWLKLDRYLALPSPLFSNLWLPLLFALAYALAWLGRWLWDLLGPEQESVVFPDIDQAWNEAVRALDAAGVDLTASPLFLVLGRPQRTEEPLFQSIQPRPLVMQAPRRADAPLHVTANREGVYVSCPGASLLGRLAGLLTDESLAGAPSDEPSGEPGDVENFATLSPTAQRGSEAIEQIIARARDQGRGVEMLLDEERQAIGKLIASQGQDDAPTQGSFAQNRAEVELQTQRLQYLCRLIARERRPYCPINGALIVLPIAAGRDDHTATQVGFAGQRDLVSVRQAVQVNFPVFALFCDMEILPGFRELTSRLPEAQRERRMGQRFPLLPDIEPSGVPAMIVSGVQQVGNRLIPNLVSSLWQVESSGGATLAESVRGNIELYQLLGSVRERQSRLARVLSRCVLPDGLPPVMLGGCYLAATGPDPAREQAFIAGVFRRLVESQDYVSWTPDAIKEDHSYRLWTRVGYAALGLAVAACAVVGGFLLMGSRA